MVAPPRQIPPTVKFQNIGGRSLRMTQADDESPEAERLRPTTVIVGKDCGNSEFVLRMHFFRRIRAVAATARRGLLPVALWATTKLTDSGLMPNQLRHLALGLVFAA